MVTNIAAYHFAAVDDPDALAGRLRERAEACALLGTVLVAGEGINLFLAGTDNAIEDFLQQLRADPRFAGLQVKYSRSAAQPFARLKRSEEQTSELQSLMRISYAVFCLKKKKH